MHVTVSFSYMLAIALCRGFVRVYSKIFLRNRQGTWNIQCTREFAGFCEMSYFTIISDATSSGRYECTSFGSCLPTDLQPFIVAQSEGEVLVRPRKMLFTV